MAVNIRRTEPHIKTLVAALLVTNQRVGAGAFFHLDASDQVVTAPTAVDLPTSLVLANQLTALSIFQCNDVVAHKVIDPTVLPTVGQAVDLASSITVANALKAWFNVHQASTVYHYTADSTNVISAANATDLPSLVTLLNAIVTAYIAHMASAPAGALLRLISA